MQSLYTVVHDWPTQQLVGATFHKRAANHRFCAFCKEKPSKLWKPIKTCFLADPSSVQSKIYRFGHFCSSKIWGWSFCFICDFFEFPLEKNVFFYSVIQSKNVSFDHSRTRHLGCFSMRHQRVKRDETMSAWHSRTSVHSWTFGITSTWIHLANFMIWWTTAVKPSGRK